jgi:hypothetical protein
MRRVAAGFREILIIVHFTRNWLHYGIIIFACLCIVAAALQAMAG